MANLGCQTDKPRTTRESSGHICGDYLDEVNRCGKTHPLWVAQVQQAGIPKGIERRRRADGKQSLLSAPRLWMQCDTLPMWPSCHCGQVNCDSEYHRLPCFCLSVLSQ